MRALSNDMIGRLAGLCVVLLAACQGRIGEDDQGPTPNGSDVGASTTGTGTGGNGATVVDCTGAAVQPGPTLIRRLTIAEYNNTAHDLLSDSTAPASAFPAEELGDGFTNSAQAQSTSDLLIEGYETAAASLATAAVANLPKLFGCDPTTQGTTCVRTFLTSFGQKAYRRPLEAAEVDDLVTFYSTNQQAYDVPTAARMTLQTMLQSPYFLYRVETLGNGKVSRLSDYEIASRLSYLFWSSMPDAPLFASAAAGQLGTSSGILEHAQRLFKDPRAQQSIGTFYSQWLGYASIGGSATIQKDPVKYPKFTPAVQKLLFEEANLFTSDVALNGGTLGTLLLGNYTFMNKDLAAFYGVSGPGADTFQKVMLDPSKRAGFLTLAGLMAVYGKVNDTAPVPRGFFVRNSLLCNPPPAPPPNIPALPPPDPTLTTRQRLAQHRTAAVCAGCHDLMDPVGLGFEHFDAEGLWRDQEAGKPVDATGNIVQTTDADGPFDGAIELATKLSKSEQVAECTVKQSFRYGFGRSELDMDQCTLQALYDAFGKSGGNLGQLFVSLTQTDAFANRTNQ